MADRKEVEFAGGSLDGATIRVPADVVAIVTIREVTDGHLFTELAICRGHDLTREQAEAALLGLLIDGASHG